MSKISTEELVERFRTFSKTFEGGPLVPGYLFVIASDDGSTHLEGNFDADEIQVDMLLRAAILLTTRMCEKKMKELAFPPEVEAIEKGPGKN